MTSPRSLAVSDENVGLVTDLYQLTMAAAYFDSNRHHPATFELFVRHLPTNRGYLLAAGLEQAVHYLSALRFTDEGIAFLRAHPVFAHVSPDFFEYLRALRFTGTVHAIPEGTVVFGGEPLLRVTAPIIQAQLVETYLLTTLNYQTLVATKAARVVEAAQGRPVVDFGSRRAHGPQAGVLAARAAFVGGCAGTSNVFAGYELDIPIVGTMAHSFMMNFPSEEEAYRAYHRVFPEHTTLLIDTYDTIEGARLATRMGPGIRGVRLDSGDLAALSQQVRAILDSAGMKNVQIVASGDLNEYRIRDLLQRGARIDLFGVGTELVTSRDEPTLTGVYKLVEYRDGERIVPVVKLSEEKATYPGKKQVYRRADETGAFREDVIGMDEEHLEGTPLLLPVIEDGALTSALPTIRQIQERAREQLARLPSRYRALTEPSVYPVRYSDRLSALRRQVEQAAPRPTAPPRDHQEGT